MSRLSRPSWTVWLALVVLFALSLLAPQWWRQAQRTGHSLAAPPAASAPAPAAACGHVVSQPPQALPLSAAAPTPPRFEPAAASADASQIRTASLETAAVVPCRSELSAANGPDFLQVCRLPQVMDEPVVEVAAIDERIELDPSIAESPNLPPPSQAPADTPPSLPDLPDMDRPLPPQPAPVPAPSAPQRSVVRAWAYPAGLIEQLNGLAANVPLAAKWAQRTIGQLEQLAQVPELNDPQAKELVQRLQAGAEEALRLADAMHPDEERSQLIRASYALARRVEVWGHVHQLACRGPASLPDLMHGLGDLDACLAEVEASLRRTGDYGAWSKFLKWDELRPLLAGDRLDPAARRLRARDALRRLGSSQLSAEQAAFLENGPFLELNRHLQLAAHEEPDLRQLLAAIERFEHAGQSAESRALAELFQVVRWSPDEATAALGSTLNCYYRNANVRVALSPELVNRLLPQQQTMQEPVVDTIRGAFVEGDSAVATRLRLVLLPDRHHWRMGLEAHGDVASATASSKGPATFYQDGQANFRARKLLLIDRRGLRLYRAEAEANSETNLRDFETNFDSIPLFGGLARMIARNQYDQESVYAKPEVESKIRDRATSRLDQEVAQRLEKAQQDFQAKLLTPLRRLRLDPTPVDMETTVDRLIARYRLAGWEQLAAHTPRPQAPGDSLLSVQVHDSALNNTLQHLGLESRKVELRELYKELVTTFNPQPDLKIPEDLPEAVFVTFPDQDPVRVDCQDGRLRLTIRLAELSHEEHRWRNFTVRGYYVPDSQQLDANLVRDGVIELAGERLRLGDQIALRAIFSKVLSRNRKINLVNKQLSQAPELKDLLVTQFVIHDGWIGVAMGPQANRPPQVARFRVTDETETD